jgi:hypothetical protein
MLRRLAHRLPTILLLASTLVGADAVAKDAKAAKVPIELWLRKPVANPTTAGVAVKGNLVTIDLAGLTPDTLTTVDVQYGGEFRYRGMHVRDLIALFKPMPATVDMLLLHTRNGMIVPVAFEFLRADRQVFVAVEMYRDKKWRKDFPTSVRATEKDERPLNFTGNKLVVGSDWRATKNGFTPWRYVDTLVGIEFVESGAYFEQFRLRPNLQEHAGKAVYLGRCQFCHAIRGFGARLGPELTAVPAVQAKDGAAAIYEKVRVAQSPAASLSHLMPNQSDFTKTDAKDLLDWLKDATAGELGPYAPSYATSVKWR